MRTEADVGSPGPERDTELFEGAGVSLGRPEQSLVHPSFSNRLLAELGSLLRMARRLTRSEADAQDLVQATVVRAIEHRAELRDNERMRAWLHRIQRTVLLNGRRGLAHKLELIHGAPAESEPRGDLEAELLERELPDELADALARLSSEHRDALLLREIEGLTYQEISAIQQCPLGTVRSRIARARLALLEMLSNEDERSPWKSALKSGS